jgi:serine/threonine protein phosphatase PrpC
MEDDKIHTILKDNSVLLGVLDGHWSAHCAQFVSQFLPKYIEKVGNKDIKKGLSEAYQELDKALLDLPWKVFPKLSDSIESIMETNPQTKIEALVKCLPAFAGSCAVTAHINGSMIHVAHAGDW